MPNSTRYLIDSLCIAVVVSVSASASSISVGETRPASEISELVSLNVRSIKNVSFSVTWNDSIDGRSLQYSTLATVYDSLGRIRTKEIDKGTYDSAGNKVPSRKGRTDKLFDGEKSVVVNTQTDLDEAGKPIVASSGVYRYAIIADAMAGPSKWRTVGRNPIANSPEQLLASLDKLALLKQVVEVTPTKHDHEEAVMIQFQQGGLDVTATLLPTWSWALRELVHKDSTGRTTKHFRAEYTRTNEGLSLPTRGTLMFLAPKIDMSLLELPKSGKGPVRKPIPSQLDEPSIIQSHQWQFEIFDLVVNDPNFDESIFVVSLPAGTRVADNRYKTTYVVGEAKAADAELSRLALQARDQPESLRRVPRDSFPGPRTYTYMIWMTLGSAALAVAVVIAGIFGRRVFYS